MRTNNLQAIVIDPTDNISPVLEHLQKKNCTLSAILITHAHFDHILGCGLLKKHFPDAVIYLHPDDLNLWTTGGGAGHFGYTTATLPPPDAWLKHNDRIAFDDLNLQVLHTPGHTPGHVIFYSPEMGVVFCGDLNI